VTIEAPLNLYETEVLAEWVDYNDHMSESYFLLVFGDAADQFFRLIGIDDDYRAAGQSLYTIETHIHHRRELKLGEPLVVTLQLLDHDERFVHIFHEMRHGETGDLVASAEQMLVHVDMAAGRSSTMPAYVQERLDTIRDVHRDLPTPAVVGRPMGIRRS
jgi:carnitine 3-dehydrogenase